MDDRTPQEETPEAGEEKWPIGFLIVVTLTALYLAWRLVQGIMWVLHRF